MWHILLMTFANWSLQHIIAYSLFVYGRNFYVHLLLFTVTPVHTLNRLTKQSYSRIYIYIYIYITQVQLSTVLLRYFFSFDIKSISYWQNTLRINERKGIRFIATHRKGDGILFDLKTIWWHTFGLKDT